MRTSSLFSQSILAGCPDPIESGTATTKTTKEGEATSTEMVCHGK